MAGSSIPLGLTEEQREIQRLEELKKRQLQKLITKAQQEDLKMQVGEFRAGLATIPIGSKMAVIKKSEEYIYKYEMVLQEREEEAKWK